MSPSEWIALASIVMVLASTLATIGINWGRVRGQVDASKDDLRERFSEMERHIQTKHETLKTALDENRAALAKNTEAVECLDDSVQALRKDISTLEVLHGERITRAEERIDSLQRSRRYGHPGIET